MKTLSTRYVSDVELEEIYGINRRTLRRWRLMGQGPAYSKAGRLVRYDLADVERWLQHSKVNGDGTKVAA